jgi:Protein of unknown function (DUF3800)
MNDFPQFGEIPSEWHDGERRRYTVLVITAFGDESADETRQRSFAVAAVGASDDEWKRLEGAWLERTGGIPFHATDCESDRGVYADRPHAENKALYIDLVGIIAQSKAWGWGAAYDLKSYREVFPSINQDMCYLRAFLAVVDFFNDFAKSHFNDIVKYTFDSREQSNYSAGKIYDLMANDPANSFMPDEISFASSRKQPRLQIADLFTFEVMKELDNRIGPVVRPRRKSISALTEHGRFGCDLFPKEYFEDMRTKLPSYQSKDPTFTEQAYSDWLTKHEKQDSPRNRLHFLIWFLEKEQKQRNR